MFPRTLPEERWFGSHLGIMEAHFIPCLSGGSPVGILPAFSGLKCLSAMGHRSSWSQANHFLVVTAKHKGVVGFRQKNRTIYCCGIFAAWVMKSKEVQNDLAKYWGTNGLSVPLIYILESERLMFVSFNEKKYRGRGDNVIHIAFSEDRK